MNNRWMKEFIVLSENENFDYQIVVYSDFSFKRPKDARQNRQ